MNVITRIVPASGAAFLVTINACGVCFYSPSMVQDRIKRGAVYQNPKTQVLHAANSWTGKTYCGRNIPKEHQADVSVVVT